MGFKRVREEGEPAPAPTEPHASSMQAPSKPSPSKPPPLKQAKQHQLQQLQQQRKQLLQQVQQQLQQEEQLRLQIEAEKTQVALHSSGQLKVAEDQVQEHLQGLQLQQQQQQQQPTSSVAPIGSPHAAPEPAQAMQQSLQHAATGEFWEGFWWTRGSGGREKKSPGFRGMASNPPDPH